MNLNQTTTIPSGKDIQRKWFVLDASGQTLGRLASRAANVLTGKNNPLYTPYIDMGDHVIVINAEKIHVTGMKARPENVPPLGTGFPGGLREEGFTKLLARRPEKIVRRGHQAACCPSPSSAARWPPSSRFTRVPIIRTTLSSPPRSAPRDLAVGLGFCPDALRTGNLKGL